MYNIKNVDFPLQVIGYVNPNRFFPSPLIAICSDHNNQVYSIYPNGDYYILDNFSIEKLSNLNFIKEKKETKFYPDKINYAFSADNILVESPQNLNKILAKISIEEKSSFIKEILTDFINSNSSKTEVIVDFDSLNTWDSFLNLSHVVPSVRVIINWRKVRNKNKIHQRMIFQYKRRSDYKSFFKKNINFENTISDNNISHLFLKLGNSVKNVLQEI